MFQLAVIKPIVTTVGREFVNSANLLLCVSFLMFILLYVAPGDDIFSEFLHQLSASDNMREENIGLLTGYFIWLANTFQGNLGLSSSNGIPVLDLISTPLINSLILILSALILSVIISIPLAVLTARKTKPVIRIPLNTSINLLSVLPLFWLAYIVIYLCGIWFNYLPLSFGFNTLNVTQFILPILLLGLGSGVMVEMIQQISHEINRVSKEDYILFARAKGASVAKHMLKEAIIFPLLQILSNRIAYLFGATIVIEQIFNWPGIGRIMWQATQERDIALLMASILLTAVIIRASYFIARTIYILLNPRASHE